MSGKSAGFPQAVASGKNRAYCAHGHLYDEPNTYITSEGWRQCRTCNRQRLRRLKNITPDRWIAS